VAARRGEIWRVSLDPTTGHGQAGDRPALIVSDDRFNVSAAGLAVIVPRTSRERGIPSHVAIDPPEAGVRERSLAMCEQVRTISVARLRHGPWGPPVSQAIMTEVEWRLRLLLGLQLGAVEPRGMHEESGEEGQDNGGPASSEDEG
jgi:mRNA interferase MazF